jgi:hypothetical protein
LAEKANGRRKTEYCITCIELNEAQQDGSTAIYETKFWFFLTRKERPKVKSVEQRVAGFMFII